MRFTFLKRRMAYNSKLLLSLKPSEHLKDDLHMTRSSVILHGFQIMSWDIWGFPGGSDSKESAFQCRSPGFNPWVRKIPWRRKWLLTPVFLPVEFHGQRVWWGATHGATKSRPRVNDSHLHYPGVFTDCYV